MREANPLFRPQAVAHRNEQFLGSIVLLRPLTFRVFTGAAVAVATLVIALLFFGRYTRKATLRGELVPQRGLISVQPPQPGIVLERRVEEGQSVGKGDVLFVLSAERRSSRRGDTQAAITRQNIVRRHSLHEELTNRAVLQREQRATLTRQIVDLEAERTQLEAQIDAEERRLRSFQATLARLEDLGASGIVPDIQVQEKGEEGLAREAQLHSLRRSRAALARSIRQAQADLIVLPLTSLAPALQRGIAEVEQALSESEAQREFVVAAPQDGVATAILAEPGRTVATTTTLARIVPGGSPLEARLYAPSRTVGFIEPGQTVRLRYQAFPYAKFGLHEGTVTAVSRATVGPDEVAPGTGASPDATGAEPMYRITVALRAQTVRAYGREHSLQAGMLLDAAVVLDRRSLVEWLLEPLYTMSGRL